MTISPRAFGRDCRSVAAVDLADMPLVGNSNDEFQTMPSRPAQRFECAIGVRIGRYVIAGAASDDRVRYGALSNRCSGVDHVEYG